MLSLLLILSLAATTLSCLLAAIAVCSGKADRRRYLVRAALVIAGVAATLAAIIQLKIGYLPGALISVVLLALLIWLLPRWAEPEINADSAGGA